MRYFLQKDRFQDRVLNIRKRFSAFAHAILMVVMFLAPTQLFADDVEINKTNFPDSVFRHIVDSITGNTGTLTASTAQNITLFGTALVGKGIKDLTGLKYFTSLTNLDCRNNPGLTSIDLSGNNALQNLLITGCKVTSLDFTHNPNMRSINCVGMKTLTSINVDSCANLEKLYIGDNPYTELNITNNKKLTLLSVYKTGLTTLDLSNNGKLSILYAFGNPQLQVLDLKNDTSLINLYAYDNNWPSIDVSTLAKLKIFDCHGNNLTKLDVSKNTALQTLSFYDNQLTTIDLSKNTRLTSLDCHNNKLTSLSLNLTDDSQLKTLSIYSNAMASFDMSNYTGMTSNNQSGRQHRRMMLYTDGTDAYMLVEKGIDARKISDATLNIPSDTTSITFSVGTENADGLVPLKFSNKAVRKQLFNWAASLKRVTPITITYNYNTGSSLAKQKTMDVTDTVECYLLPMSQEYGSVNLPYDVLLPTGATAYAISATDIQGLSKENTATLTKIADEGEIVAANTPMLIKRTNNTYTLFALNQSSGTAKEASANLLQGTQNYAITNQDTYYVLGINDNPVSSTYNQLGFWHSTQNYIGTWRAYLNITDASAAKGFVLSLDAPTGISRIENAESSVDAPWYTLDGRTLGAKPSRQGIYIHNRKKITISK